MYLFHYLSRNPVWETLTYTIAHAGAMLSASSSRCCVLAARGLNRNLKTALLMNKKFHMSGVMWNWCRQSGCTIRRTAYVYVFESYTPQPRNLDLLQSVVFQFKFSDQNFVRISDISQVFYTLYPFHSPRFDYPNILRAVQVTKLYGVALRRHDPN